MQVITSFTYLRFVVPALLKDKTCHRFTCTWMKQSHGLTETSKIRVQKQQMWSLHFFLGVFAHIHGQSLCHPGIHATETQPCASHLRGCFVCCY